MRRSLTLSRRSLLNRSNSTAAGELRDAGTVQRYGDLSRLKIPCGRAHG